MLRDLPRRTRLLVAAAVLVGAATTIVGGAVLLSQRPADASGPASLEDAVALGILDQEVLDAVRVDGQAEGIVSIETDEIIERVQAQFPEAARQAEAFEASLGLVEAAKRRLTSELRDRAAVEVDFQNLANIVLRFRGEGSLLTALRLPMVSGIRANRILEPTLDESRRIVRQAEAVVGHGGAGTYVAVLDTGVDDAAYPTYFRPGSVPVHHAAGDADGSALKALHGTHVASTVLAMAPDTRIIAVDVFRWELWRKLLLKGPGASDTSILAGIEHVMELKRAYLADPTQCCNVVAMNLSLGSTEYHRSFCEDGYSFGLALSRGIIPVVASGNDALDKSKTFNAGVGSPACSKHALSVGATTDGVVTGSSECEPGAGADALTTFSQTGPTLQILAPGSCIVAAGGAMQGTSMAAPHVAGAIAVLASARPGASATEIWAALKESGVPIADSRITPTVTAGRLDIAAAVERLLATGPTASASPAADRSAPIVRPPAAVIRTGVQAQPDGRMSVSVSWAASDDSGVSRYSLRQRSGGGDWSEVPLPRADATTVVLTLAPGAAYQFGVAAEDRAGNRSDWVDGPELAFDLVSEADASVAYSGDPWTAAAYGEAIGGNVRPASTSGAEACLSFTGRYVGWIATRAADRGVATVMLDGRQVATVDLGGATSPRSVVYARPVDAGAAHVLCVRAEGTAARPMIDVDGFAILR